MGVAKNATKSGEMNKVSYSISSEMAGIIFSSISKKSTIWNSIELRLKGNFKF